MTHDHESHGAEDGKCSHSHSEHDEKGQGCASNIVHVFDPNEHTSNDDVHHEGCDHGDAHKHGGGCGHDHHDHETHDKPENYNYGLLKTIFTKADVNPDGFLERHRSKIILGAAAALAVIEQKTTGAASMSTSLAMIFGSAMVAHDASEDLMEAAGQLNESHNISSGVVGMAVGAAHTASEGFLSVSSQMSGYEDIAVATTMGSNVSHIPLMAGLAGLIGAVSIDESYAYKMNAAFMGGVTASMGYQIATGEFNPWLSGATMAAGGTYLLWRVSAGQTCAVHGDGCGHVAQGAKNTTDYISSAYWADLAEKVKNVDYGDAFSRLTEGVEHVKSKLANVSLATAGQMSRKLNKAAKALAHENVVKLGASLTALGVSAHVLGANVINIAEQGGLSATAVGASVAALAFALPELILTGKAALKKDGEMAWGAVTGCTVATVGIVGGYQGLSGFDVPASLSLVTTEGQVQMAAFVGSAATIIAAVHPWSARQLAKVDNAMADVLENKFKRVSNWLRNDGTKLPKVVAAPMLAAALAYYGASTLPVCHSHGEFVHCFQRDANAQIAPSFD